MAIPASRAVVVRTVLAGISAMLLVLTLISREWIELLFGVEPDGGNGSLEWVVTGLFALTTLALAASARMRWVRDVGEAARAQAGPHPTGPQPPT